MKLILFSLNLFFLWNNSVFLLLVFSMVKQFTALILILAIANPFCCCFGNFFDSENVQNLDSSQSCCQSSLSKNTDSSSPSDQSPPCPKECPCEKTYLQSDANDLGKTIPGDTLSTKIVTLKPASEFTITSVSSSYFGTSFSWRPPPPQVPLYLMHCVSRI